MQQRLTPPRRRSRDPRAQPPGPPPFGYVRDSASRLVMTDEHRDLIAHIVYWRTQGRSAQAIADGLNGDGVPSPRGGTWQRGTVLKIAKRGFRA